VALTENIPLNIKNGIRPEICPGESEGDLGFGHPKKKGMQIVKTQTLNFITILHLDVSLHCKTTHRYCMDLMGVCLREASKRKLSDTGENKHCHHYLYLFLLSSVLRNLFIVQKHVSDSSLHQIHGFAISDSAYIRQNGQLYLLSCLTSTIFFLALSDTY